MGERYVYNIFLFFLFFLGWGDFTHCTLNSRRAIPDTYQLGLYVLDIPNSRLLSGLNDSIFSTKVSPVDHLSPFHSYKHVQKIKTNISKWNHGKKKELIYRYTNNWTHLKQNHYYKNNDKFSLSETRDMYNSWN